KKRNVAAKTTSVRRATTATKAPETKRVPKKTNIATTKKPVTKTKSSIDISLESSKKLNNKPQEMSLKKAQVAAKPKTSLTSVLRNIALVSVFFSLFFMICYRYSVINEKFNSIKKMKNELAEIQAVNGQVQADIESKTDLTYVENYAKYQLGMQKPTSSQTQYVSVEKKDKITTPVVMEDENEMNWFEKIINEIRKIID
ncbi:MAG: septum formation initiator family protein, partial [Clostridia bacterium]|nr:septum formation initiator family protein [Clostridia bacterium]